MAKKAEFKGGLARIYSSLGMIGAFSTVFAVGCLFGIALR